MLNNNIIISIEGNIGSGKSTLINKLKTYFSASNVLFLDEPLNEWLEIKDNSGTDILEKFYDDKEKYSFSFQMMAYISRLNTLKKALKDNHNNIIITERSLSTDKHVFAKMLFDSNYINTYEYQIYNKWFDSFNEETSLTHIIYVNADPNVCFNRIEERSRNGENKISKDYLINCHNYHNKMIDTYKKTNIPILNLDGNLNIFDDLVFNKWVNSIISLMSESTTNSNNS